MTPKLNEILEHATSQGYRSNIVKPLSGLMIIELMSSATFVYLKADILAYIMLGTTLLTFVGFGVSYFFCLFKNPDLLRSEKYNLEKTAIEKVTSIGDSFSPAKIVHPPMDYITVHAGEKKRINPKTKKLEE